MKVLLTGATGQVGLALAKSAPANVELVALPRAMLDIADERQVYTALQAHRPDLVINAAAYTHVDRAESEQDQARQVNELGPRNLASAAALIDARLIHISTDYVFDGESARPYTPEDLTAPLGAYGRTKLGGELAVRALRPANSVILRTAWVYSAQGLNFARTMLRLMKERGSVRVVADQIGAPTAADSIAGVIWKMAALPSLHGLYHWTDAGVASWYDFAVGISEEALALGYLRGDVTVAPITTEEYPTAARRPRLSLLDCRRTVEATGVARDHWRVWLRRALREMHSA